MSYCQNCADKEREVERLKGERDKATTEWSLHQISLAATVAEGARLRARATALEEGLKRYGGHLVFCPGFANDDAECTCGLRKAPGGVEMSDKHVVCPACIFDDGPCEVPHAANCPRVAPAEAPAPLSPIALDFEAAEREADIAFERYGLSGPHANTAYNDALNAQLRAIVARVAQEEREKCAKELEVRAERLFNDPALGWRFDEQSRRIRLACAAFLRGTP